MSKHPLISVVYIVKNGGALFEKSLLSVVQLADEIVVIDNASTDNSIQTAQTYGALTYTHSAAHEGTLRKYALSKASGEWVLFLDHDEIIPKKLSEEICHITRSNTTQQVYAIEYTNHLFGRPLSYGAETYSMVRLFKKNHVSLVDSVIHAQFVSQVHAIATLQNHIYHYSYISIPQIFSKFSQYAYKTALEKYKNKEKITIKKLVLYGPHMFWARFIKDKGYKDGSFRIILDIAFAYMEALTYWLLLLVSIKKFTMKLNRQ